MKSTHIGFAMAAAYILGCFCLASPTLADDTQSAPTVAAALREGNFSLNWRYRYEFVEQDGYDLNAGASTLRTAIKYDTKAFHGFLGGFEVEDVTAIGNKYMYNNLGAPGLNNGVTDRPAVADPEILEFNQLYLVYEGLHGTQVKAGRQEYMLDNQRFVGNVGWRQNHQSFDAAALKIGALKNWRFRYAYLDRQFTVTGYENYMSTNLIHAAYDSPIGKAVAYGYLLDYNNSQLWRLSTATYGLRLDGKAELSRFDILYLAEYARQSDTANNPDDYDLGYMHARLGGEVKEWALNLGYEVLQGNGTSAVQTPLGTNHKFNGFADKFLITPANGLRDLYLDLSWGWKTWSASAVYHFFDADEGGGSYGDELDLQVSYKTPWKQVFAVKFAQYDAEGYATDTTKLMLWTTWGF